MKTQNLLFTVFIVCSLVYMAYGIETHGCDECEKDRDCHACPNGDTAICHNNLCYCEEVQECENPPDASECNSCEVGEPSCIQEGSHWHCSCQENHNCHTHNGRK